MQREDGRKAEEGMISCRRIEREILESVYRWGTDGRGKTEEVGIGGVA